MSFFNVWFSVVHSNEQMRAQFLRRPDLDFNVFKQNRLNWFCGECAIFSGHFSTPVVVIWPETCVQACADCFLQPVSSWRKIIQWYEAENVRFLRQFCSICLQRNCRFSSLTSCASGCWIFMRFFATVFVLLDNKLAYKLCLILKWLYFHTDNEHRSHIIISSVDVVVVVFTRKYIYMEYAFGQHFCVILPTIKIALIWHESTHQI